MKRSIQLTILLLALVAVIYYVSRRFGVSIAGWVSLFTTLTVIFVSAIIFLENRNPSSTMAWILVLALNPIVGFIFYILFGRNYRNRRLFTKKAIRDAAIFSQLQLDSVAADLDAAKFTENQNRLFRLAQKVSPSPISFSSKTKVLTNGSTTFEAILHELEKAAHHIHLEYYIYRDDEIGTQIKEILMKKAQAGVKVRFLYDAVGSWQLPFAFIEEMKAGGVEVVAFGPVRFPTLSSKVNYRNHRKIVVIDGKVGFIGGLNVGDEYLSRNKVYGFWRDTHLMVEGEVVRSLQIIFLQDWLAMTGETYLNQEYLSPPPLDRSDAGAVQIIASGPDHEWETVKTLFFSMITSAKESIWISTPYFIPDEDIFTALRIAALSGIQVKIIFPKRPDKWLPYLASHSYFPALFEAGVEIYEYEKGFMHSKVLIIDGEMASIGTANMDMRSFHLNFEVNAFLYGSESVETLVSDFNADLRCCHKLDRKFFIRKRVGRRFMESAARLFSPLL